MRNIKTTTGVPLRVFGGKLIEPNTIAQAKLLTTHPLVKGVALMPDAHVGIGATVGCVTHLEGGIIPSVVGVDVGCGVAGLAVRVSSKYLTEEVLHETAAVIREMVPAGVGQGHDDAPEIDGPMPVPTKNIEPMLDLARKQFGTLGAGNHFFEVCIAANNMVWLIVHSGSRGIGNKIATMHINRAEALNPFEGGASLGWYETGTPEYDEYLADMVWLQNYAYFSRLVMLRRVQRALGNSLSAWLMDYQMVNCHHNYATLDTPGTHIVRKGAIDAHVATWGLIPGSMGGQTFLVKGKGYAPAYESAPHGAGRRLARGEARRSLDVDEFKTQMGARVWQDRDAESLLDEAPNAYKNLDAVMTASSPLVKVVDRLTPVVNYKGV